MESVRARTTNSAYQFRNFLNHQSDDAREIEAGLRAHKKIIAPKFFYDELGQRLFDEISATEDYYLTRAEMEILSENAGEMAEMIGSHSVLIEPGCGNCTKIEYLLKQSQPELCVMIDIAEPALQSAARRLVFRYPGLNCMAVAADFSDLSPLQNLLPPLRRVVFYPGSTIGNFEPDDAIDFLRTLRNFIGADGGLLIGVDLEKDAAILERCVQRSRGRNCRV